MVTVALLKEVEHAAARAEVWLPRAVDDDRHAGVDDRPGTHGARLERDIERACVKPPRAARAACLGDGLHLGVGVGPVRPLTAVAAAADDAARAVGDHAADRHFAVGRRGVRERERCAHIVLALHRRSPLSKNRRCHR